MSRMLNLSWIAWSRANAVSAVEPATARRHLEHVVAMAALPEPELASAHRSLAGCHLRSARYAEARRHLRSAIELQPNCADTIRQLARAWEDDPYGDDLRAAHAYRRATRVDSNDAIAWAALGRAALRVGRNRLASKSIRRAVRLAPADDRVLAIVVDALREAGKLSAAQRIATRARFLNPRSTAIRELGDRIRYEIARTGRPANPASNSTGSNLLPFVRVVGSDGERRVVRRDEPSRPQPVSIRLRG
jgi:tetratricopeptide (TPR) repeat protein